MRTKIDMMDKKLSTTLSESEATNRRMKVDEFTLNVIEKKIENIYTLIGRNKIGGKIMGVTS